MKPPARSAALAAALTLGWLAGCSGADPTGAGVSSAPSPSQLGDTPASLQVLARSLELAG